MRLAFPLLILLCGVSTSIAVMYHARSPLTIPPVTLGTPSPTSEEAAILAEAGSGSLMETCQEQERCLSALITHEGKLYTAARHTWETTENPEVRTLADHLWRRSLQLLLTLGGKEALPALGSFRVTTDEEFLQYAERDLTWRNGLLYLLLGQQTPHDHLLLQSIIRSRLEMDVVTHLAQEKRIQ